MNDTFQQRAFIIRIVFILAGIVLLYKAMNLQLLDTSYRSRANAIAIDKVTLYPARGLILDRNGKLLVYNNAIYDIMVVYNQINPKMDTFKFCQLVGIDKKNFIQQLDKDWRSGRYSKALPFAFMNKISAENFAALQESLYEFPGFSIRLKNVRGYPHNNAAHILGYLNEVDQQQIDSLETYTLGDYIGVTGLELAYEGVLRGKKGVKYILKDNMGREVSAYEDGNLDSTAISGADLITSIDIELQQYCEKIMQNKKGSIVAIEPQTGEILAMVSSPTYNPNLLIINRDRGAAFKQLLQDTLQPLFNRTIMAKYPPGSVFKTVVSLVAMEEKIITQNTGFSCSGAYMYNGKRMTGCHMHPYPSNVQKALQYSCNAYFCHLIRGIIDQYGFHLSHKGLNTFNDYLDKFGLGKPLGIDFPNENAGNIPTVDYYDKLYGEKKWRSPYILSIGIGQGEIETTTMQMANLAATIANKGYYYTPHLAKGFQNLDQDIDKKYKQKNFVGIASHHFIPVVDGMEAVVVAGTARWAFIPDIAICGKTGTSQNAGKDHSVFFSFAPKENPQIALAVYVENAGAGGSYAAPISSLVIEKYLTDSIRTNRKYLEHRMMTANLISQ